MSQRGRSKKPPVSEAKEAAIASEPAPEHAKKPPALLTVQEANALLDTRLAALAAAKEAQADLESRMRQGDDSIGPEDFLSDREIRHLELSVEVAFSKLDKAIAAEGKARSDQLWSDSQILSAKAERLSEAHEGMAAAISEFVAAGADFLDVHGELARRAASLPGVPADPEKRGLEPHAARFFAFEKFAPTIDGRTFDASWALAPAVMANIVRTTFEAIPARFLPDKWQRLIRDRLVNGFDPRTGATDPDFVSMKNDANKLARLATNFAPSPLRPESNNNLSADPDPKPIAEPQPSAPQPPPLPAPPRRPSPATGIPSLSMVSPPSLGHVALDPGPYDSDGEPFDDWPATG
jgi:hypothetical protein